MFNRLIKHYRRLPHYLSYRAPFWIFELFAPWLYRHCVPRLQDTPVIVLTMGKVGTITCLNSLRNAGVLFASGTHHLHRKPKLYPCFPLGLALGHRMQVVTRFLYLPWVARLPRLRVITIVREPIARVLSLYFFSYLFRFGQKLEDTSLQTLLKNFPRLFDQDYVHPLVPNYFFTNQIQHSLGIDVYQHPSPRADGAVTIEKERVSLLVMKLEITDEQKADALSAWIGRSIHIGHRNTASEGGYADLYEEFKRRVRIPYRYAEAIYRSSYMQHFYTSEERTKFWKRWEPQLDKSIPLPDWVESQLQEYHPPVAELPQEAPL